MAEDFLGTPFANILAKIQEQFPQYLPFLNEPGIFQVLSDAITNPAAWSPERFTAAIQKTPFFQNTTFEQRQWYILDVTDPATAAKKKSEATLTVAQIQAQLGVHISAYDAAIIGLNAAVNAWDPNRIRMELVAKMNGSMSMGPGGIGDKMTELKGMAAQYGVPVADKDLFWWASNVVGGALTQEGYRNEMTRIAKNLYPALTPALDEGQTVAQYAQPYFAMATQELGINPSQITLLNPKWLEVFLGKDDKGAQRVLNMNEALAKVRSDPALGYDHGTPAKTQAAQFAGQLLQQFGASG